MNALQKEIRSAVERTTALSVNTRKELYPLLDKELIEFQSKLTFKPINQKHLLWLYINNITEKPKCKQCNINSTTYKNYKEGYIDYCSRQCLKESGSLIKKRKETNLKKYGCEFPFQSKDIQSKIKSSFKEKYGVEKPFQLESIREKIKQG